MATIAAILPQSSILMPPTDLKLSSKTCCGPLGAILKGCLFDKCLYSRPHEHGMSKSQLGRDKVDAQWLQLLPDNYLRACTCLNALRSRGQNEAEDFFCRSTLHKNLPLPLLSNDTYHYSNKAVRHQIRVAQLDFKPLLNAGADSSRWIRAAGLCKLSWTIHSAA